MRSALMGIMALVALASPAMGAILISLQPDSPTLYVGQQTTVRVFAQGTEAGIASVGGSIVASGDEALAAVLGSFTFVPEFRAWGDVSSAFAPALGTPGIDGGWSRFGSMRTDLPFSDDYGKSSPVEIARYKVQGVAEGQVTLSFEAATVKGYLPAESNENTTLGPVSNAGIQVLLPEPAAMVLLILAWGTIRTRRP